MKKPTQRNMFYKAHDEVFGLLRQFAEIQRGPNPLTNDDIERMIARRPGHWEKFRGKGIDKLKAE